MFVLIYSATFIIFKYFIVSHKLIYFKKNTHYFNLVITACISSNTKQTIHNNDNPVSEAYNHWFRGKICVVWSAHRVLASVKSSP